MGCTGACLERDRGQWIPWVVLALSAPQVPVPHDLMYMNIMILTWFNA
jgi:hypothetical protein